MHKASILSPSPPR